MIILFASTLVCQSLVIESWIPLENSEASSLDARTPSRVQSAGLNLKKSWLSNFQQFCASQKSLGRSNRRRRC